MKCSSERDRRTPQLTVRQNWSYKVKSKTYAVGRRPCTPATINRPWCRTVCTRCTLSSKDVNRRFVTKSEQKITGVQPTSSTTKSSGYGVSKRPSQHFSSNFWRPKKASTTAVRRVCSPVVRTVAHRTLSSYGPLHCTASRTIL